MAQAKSGDTVKVHYTGKLKDGKVFDSSSDREPFIFTIGNSEVLPGVEQAVIGMKPDESKTAWVQAENAFGPRRDELVVEVDRSRLPAELRPEVGQQLHISKEDGKTQPAEITDVSESTVTIDTNHPLAGKNLYFDIQLVDIV